MDILHKIIAYRSENDVDDSSNTPDEITLSIKKYEEVLQKSFANSELKHLIENSLNKCKHLKSLHNDYLEISKKQRMFKRSNKNTVCNLESKKKSSEFLFKKLEIIESMRETIKTLNNLKAKRKILKTNNPATY